MNRMTRFAVGVLGTVVLLALVPLSAFAATAPSLGAAANFVVLGGAGVTCTASSITGNVGSKLTVTHDPSCTIAGAIVQGAGAVTAFNNFDTAYTTLKGLTCPAANNLTGQELGGKTLASGVYCFASTAALSTGILRLTGSGPWIFQIGSGITTAGPGQVVMAGGSACNVFWVPTSAATIGTGTKFLGNILAGSAITFTGTGSSLKGRALAHTAVTATGATITGCGANAGKGGDEDENEDQDKDDGHHDGNGDHDGDHNGGDHHGDDHSGGD